MKQQRQALRSNDIIFTMQCKHCKREFKAMSERQVMAFCEVHEKHCKSKVELNAPAKTGADAHNPGGQDGK